MKWRWVWQLRTTELMRVMLTWSELTCSMVRRPYPQQQRLAEISNMSCWWCGEGRPILQKSGWTCRALYWAVHSVESWFLCIEVVVVVTIIEVHRSVILATDCCDQLWYVLAYSALLSGWDNELLLDRWLTVVLIPAIIHWRLMT